MKSMRPPSAAIIFMTYFYRAGVGRGGPLGPSGSATENKFLFLFVVAECVVGVSSRH